MLGGIEKDGFFGEATDNSISVTPEISRAFTGGAIKINSQPLASKNIPSPLFLF